MNWRCAMCWELVQNERSACCGEVGRTEPDPDAEEELSRQHMAQQMEDDQ